MLTVYLIALAVGGTLLIVSLVMSSNHDGDVDTELGALDSPEVDVDGAADVDAEVGPDAGAHFAGEHGSGLDAAMAWLPVVSMRFWTFFAAFFGLTGAALTLLGVGWSPVAIGLISGAVGYASGLGVVLAFRKLRKTQVDSSLITADYIGATATVMVAVAKHRTGKVRLEVKGRTVEMLADTEDEQPFAAKERAMVYAMTETGRALITRGEEASE